MSIETFYVLLALGAAIWFLRVKPKPKAPQSPQVVEKPPIVETRKAEAPVDPFLDEVANLRSQVDAQAKAATNARKRELDAQYAEDLNLRARLAEFAKNQRLDRALIDVWEKIKHYPSWSKREDFENWNKLNLKDISGSSNGKVKSVSFVESGSKYTITEKTWDGMEGERYADFALLENDEEMFSISCSVNYGEYATSHSCHRVSGFKKRGNWARVLLSLHGRIQIEDGQRAAGSGYYDADKIKSRFEE
jgi:hypothetical protein